jgi:ribosomal protein S18 acetylase RimI-like enzyme
MVGESIYIMGENITILCATNEDVNDICDFEQQARITEPDIWISEFNESEYKEKLNSANLENLLNTKIMIAKQGNSIIGRCDIAINLSLMDFKKTGYVDWIYTLTKYRGNGVGKKLLKGAENYFKNEGVEDYYLFTASNEEAKQFYHRQNDLTFSNKEVAEKTIK